MLPGCLCGTSGFSTMAFFTVLRNDRWTHGLLRSVRGGAAVVHYMWGGEFSLLPESSWEVSCVTFWKMPSDTTHFIPHPAAIFHYFICRPHLGGTEQARRNVHFISEVGRGLWWSSVSLSLFSWGIQCGRPFIHFQVALHWHLVQRGFMGGRSAVRSRPERFKTGRWQYKTNRGQVRSELGQCVKWIRVCGRRGW